MEATGTATPPNAPGTNTAPAPGPVTAEAVTSPFGGLGTRGRALRPTAKVLPEHARGHNRSLVLQTLYSQGLRSRADLARETGLTRVTVSDLVAELIGEGLVIELGPREAARPGKPATLIDIDRDAFQIIGLDLAEHSVVRGAVINLDGGIIARADVPLGDTTGSALTDLVIDLARDLAGRAGAPLLGIGIGTPGIVDPAGVVRSAPNLGWSNEPLQARVAAALGVPVFVANDANMAVLAEHGVGEGEDLLLVKVGHGVGAGLIIGGRVVVGSGFAAGEVGHVVVGTDGGPRCACGRNGCLEAWVAVPRLVAQVEAVEASGGDAAAREEVLREAGRRLGIVLAPVMGALNVAEVVLSGPADLLDGAFHDATVDSLRSRTIVDQHRDLRIRMTTLGEDIVLRGAAVMVLSGRLGVS